MKIQGPNSTNLNPYKRQVQNYEKQRKQTFKDELNISKEAQQLQQSNQVTKERSTHVNNIKNLVESGEYEINFEQVAQKMINFWTDRA